MPGAVCQRLDRGRLEQGAAVAARGIPREQSAAHVGIDGLALDAEPPRNLRSCPKLAHVDPINVAASQRAAEHPRRHATKETTEGARELSHPAGRRGVLAPI